MMTRLKVWGRITSINVQRVMWAIGELELPFERIDAGGPFGLLDTPQFRALNPNGLVPVLDDDGFILWESQAIVRYLADVYGQDRLLPGDPRKRAEADQWMDWALACIYRDIIGVCFYGLIRTPAHARRQESIDAAAVKLGKWLGVLDAHLEGRPYICGTRLTMADLGAGTLMFRYFTLDITRPRLPNVEAWYRRLQERPAYREHVMVDYQSMRVAGA